MVEIQWWRLVVRVTRLLLWLRDTFVPVARPIVPFLWVPALALVFGMAVGWALVVG
jgi:hypothetical protein